MMSVQVRTFSRAMLPQHVYALAFCIVLGIAVVLDRSAPLEFVNGEIIPASAAAGERVHVRWTTNWRRQCEGYVSRELVGSDGVIRAYRSRPLRIPASLGFQTSDTPYKLAAGLPKGRAEYRALIRFEQCGITSRIWPLTVHVPSLDVQITD